MADLYVYDAGRQAAYVQSLVDYVTQIADVGPLEELRDALFLKIQTGDGKTMVHSSPGGKSFGFQITMTNEEQFAAVVQAIKTFNATAGDGAITFPDWSRASEFPNIT